MSERHTVTALQRWSCQEKTLPSVEQTKRIHIYDFDNTLFSSPLPNRYMWNNHTFGRLQDQDFLHKGGWWHNPQILAACGQGEVKEEKRAWKGCWNESIVELVKLSMEDDEALTVLLTGRSETAFAGLLQRMIKAKGLEFDIMALKPSASPSGEVFSSTMTFKQALLGDIVSTYTGADELRIYEDRPKHVKAFRDFFHDLNSSIEYQERPPRGPIAAEVIAVSEQECLMDPVMEVAEVQKMINTNNQAILDGTAPRGAKPYKIKRTVFYTGYIIEPNDSARLRTLIPPQSKTVENDMRNLANNILIVPRPADRKTLSRVGGMDAKLRWRVTGLAVFDNRLWAARVAPVVPDAKFYTENPVPYVVLATRRNTKPVEATRIRDWQPVTREQSFEFDTKVGEKVMLRIEEEFAHEDAFESQFADGSKGARKHPRDEDFPPLGAPTGPNGRGGHPPTYPRAQQRNDGAWSNGRGGAGGIGFAAQRGGGGRGGGSGAARGRGGGGGRGRGRGGYRSLDDNVGQGYGGDTMQY